MFESILCQVADYDAEIVESLIELAVQIAREGREGRRIGTLFTLGDEAAVLERSRSLILNPLEGHPESVRHVKDPNLRGTIKELAQLDGAFVVSGAGIVVAACRYLDAAATAIVFRSGSAVATLQPRTSVRPHALWASLFLKMRWSASSAMAL
jgi:DNA integrity scanning protein DisA with diadenylate cyclase activity